MGEDLRVHGSGVGLHVRLDGDHAAPPILMLHGITDSSATYDWLIPELVQRFSVYRLDFRGHGRSDRAPGDYGVAGYVSDAMGVLRDVVGRPALVVGHSLGGGVAGVVAQQAPELVRAVFLEDPALYVSDLEGNALYDTFSVMRVAVPEVQAAGLTFAEVRAVVAATEDLSGSTLGETFTPEALDSTAEGLLGLDAAVLDPVLEGRLDRSLFDDERGVPVPGVVLAPDPGAANGLLKSREIERMIGTCPEVEVVVVDGADHMIHHGRASRPAYEQHLRRFLERFG